MSQHRETKNEKIKGENRIGKKNDMSWWMRSEDLISDEYQRKEKERKEREREEMEVQRWESRG